MQIKTHKPGTIYPQHHLFILNKGLNSGKPLSSPCPNCFVVLADSETQRNQLFYSSFILWKGRFFYPLLRGSVIPFIIIKETRQLITNAYMMLSNDKGVNIFNKLKALDDVEENLNKQLKLIRGAKLSLCHYAFNGVDVPT